MQGERLKEEVISASRLAGFDLVGVCLPEPFPEMERLKEWCRRGFHGDMSYMYRRAEERMDPRKLLAGARSVVMVGMGLERLSTGEFSSLTHMGARRKRGWRADPGAVASRGVVARFARGRDYHEAVGEGLESVVRVLQRNGYAARKFVDTSPVMEKVLAVRAGLGWRGWNTLVIAPGLGSWIALGGILTDASLPPDEPLLGGPECEKCRACIDACPTGALFAPGVLDARRCIAYWTIESRSEPPPEIREAMGDWVYGCDVCQEVCPWNPIPSPRARISTTKDS